MTYNKINFRIKCLKHKLLATDYQAIKYAEGVISPAEYAETKAQRQEWRDEINLLEERLKLLRGE